LPEDYVQDIRIEKYTTLVTVYHQVGHDRGLSTFVRSTSELLARLGAWWIIKTGEEQPEKV
jgi:hypothetical protein